MGNILKIPYKAFNEDWNLLQQFLERRGNPRYEIVGDVELSKRKDISDLGNLVRVDGDLNLVFSSIQSLGNLKYVAGDLFLHNTPIQSLGNLVRVDGDLDLRRSSIQSLENLQYVGGNLNLVRTPIKSLGNLEYIGEEIWISRNHKIPQEELTKFKIGSS